MSALLPMIKFSMRKRVRILDSEANEKGRILQSSKMLDKLSIYKTEIGPRWQEPSFASWAELAWAEFYVGRVGFGPSCPARFQVISAHNKIGPCQFRPMSISAHSNFGP